MTIDQALGIIAPEPRNLEGLQAAYKALIRKYHPDLNPNGLELTKLVNAARDMLVQTADIWTQAEYESKSDPEYHIDQEIDEIYRKIRHIPGLKITLSGVWLWVSGDTKPHKETFKTLNFRWANKKKAWYWRPADSKRPKRGRNKGEWTFEKIYNKYGKVDLDLTQAPGIQAA